MSEIEMVANMISRLEKESQTLHNPEKLDEYQFTIRILAEKLVELANS